ncbi:MAG: hypothetical protein PW734_05535 [Verrucomicrobium sp.]|nr:hypothetical protein [Verrucomicrobium sp.]
MTRLKTLAWCSLCAFLTLAAAHAAPTDQEQIDALKKTYPLTTCPISGEKLGGQMGTPVDYLYKTTDAKGKETARLVRFCCKGCVSQFKADPKPALEKIDREAAAQAAAATPHPTPWAIGGRAPCCVSAAACCVRDNGCCPGAH